MARVLVISSFVARGHVGLSGAQPVLQLLGHDVIALPTVVLSNHLGHTAWAGDAIEPRQLTAMVSALEANGWLNDTGAVIVGYLPTPAHAGFAAETIGKIADVAGAAPLVVCDPVIGDDPEGLYVGADVAAAIKEHLVPRANLLTPNRFELSWLTGDPVNNVSTACTAARQLAPAHVVVTSIPDGNHNATLVTLAVTEAEAWTIRQDRRTGVPHGTGDVLSALLTGNYLKSARCDGIHATESNDGNVAAGQIPSLAHSLANSLGSLDALIARSAGEDELKLFPRPEDWLFAPAASIAKA